MTIQIVHQQVQAMIQNKTFQFLLSVSILVFFSSSLWLPYLSTFPSHLPNYTIDRSYMFFLCNGILVFLGLVGTSPFKSATYSQDEIYQADSLVIKESDQLQGFSNLENLVVDQEEHEVIGNELVMENSDSVTEEEEESIIQKNEEGQVVQEEETSDDFRDGVEQSSLLSTDELNRKFEEFIRRMKEEIRIGAQPPLLMV